MGGEIIEDDRGTIQTISVPVDIEETATESWFDSEYLKNIAQKDSKLKNFLNSIPNNYFSLFSIEEIIEHYHFIARNSREKFGDLLDDTSIEIKNQNYSLLICKKNLSSFLLLLSFFNIIRIS